MGCRRAGRWHSHMGCGGREQARYNQLIHSSIICLTPLPCHERWGTHRTIIHTVHNFHTKVNSTTPGDNPQNNPQRHRENMQMPHRVCRNENLGPSCCEAMNVKHCTTRKYIVKKVLCGVCMYSPFARVLSSYFVLLP